MAIFIDLVKYLGQVSVCGDAYRGRVSRLRQHLALSLLFFENLKGSGV